MDPIGPKNMPQKWGHSCGLSTHSQGVLKVVPQIHLYLIKNLKKIITHSEFVREVKVSE